MAARVLLVLGFPVLLLAVALPCLGGFGDSGTIVFHAGFTGVEDGPGDGDSFPARVGSLDTITADGRPFAELSPLSGIDRERLILTDQGGDPATSFGVHAKVRSPRLAPTRLSFELTLLQPTTTFIADVTDTTGVDISITVRPGAIGINREVVPASVSPFVPYRIEVTMAPLDQRADMAMVRVMNLTTGKLVAEWAGPLPGGMDPVTGLLLVKSGASPGAVLLDEIEILRCQD